VYDNEKKPLIERVASQLRPLSNRGFEYLQRRRVHDLINIDYFYSLRWRNPENRVKEEWVSTPIWNTFISDTPVGVYMRSLDSKEHMRIYKQGVWGLYYGLINDTIEAILKYGFVIIVEGIFDAFSTKLSNTLCSFTNRFSTILLEHLTILRVPVLYIPDNDEKGRLHLRSMEERLKKSGIKFHVRRVPSKYKDLSQFLEEDPDRHGFFVGSLGDLS